MFNIQKFFLHYSTLSVNNIQDQSESDQSESEAAALKDMDGFLDEALGEDGMSSDSESEGPTPPKRRDVSHSPKVR